MTKYVRYDCSLLLKSLLCFVCNVMLTDKKQKNCYLYLINLPRTHVKIYTGTVNNKITVDINDLVC